MIIRTNRGPSNTLEIMTIALSFSKISIPREIVRADKDHIARLDKSEKGEYLGDDLPPLTLQIYEVRYGESRITNSKNIWSYSGKIDKGFSIWGLLFSEYVKLGKPKKIKISKLYSVTSA